jgi:hypothetical protein
MMALRVYFCFHYDDVETFRANVVRNHDLTKETGKAGFFDASIWEDAELHGAGAVKGLINRSLENTTVTCALIGTDTWKRRWVRYEILKSYDRKNRLLGVHINGVKDKHQQTYAQGPNPFDYLGFFISADGKKLTYYEHDGKNWQTYQDLPPKSASFEEKWCGRGYKLSSWAPCYDWSSQNGFKNFASWVDNAK